MGSKTRTQSADTNGPGLPSLLWPADRPQASQGTVLDQTVAADLDIHPLVQALSGYDSRREPFVTRLLTTLCADPMVITYRAAIVRNLLDEPALKLRLTALLRALAPLGQERHRSLFGVEWTVTEILQRVSELELYVDAALAVAEAFDTPLLRAPALCALQSAVRALVKTDEFQALRENLPALRTRLDAVQSVTIGVNLSSGFLPESATILSIDEKRVDGQGGFLHRLLGREVGRRGITPLRRPPTAGSGAFFPPMPGNGRGHENELVRDLRRLLERVVAPIGAEIERYTAAHLRDCARLESELAFLLNGVALLERLRRAGLPICIPEIAPADERLTRLEDSYSVSLALRMLGASSADAGGQTTGMVTNPIIFDAKEGRVWILTGPNRGGKTTYARAVGQAQILFQAGLFVPACRGRLSPVDAIYTHFPHRESPTTGEGRLDEEARRLAEIFRQATPHSLILLNEVLSGTSTLEALALARDAVRGLRLLGARAIYVTHLHELANHVEEINTSTPGDGMVGSLVAEVDDRQGDEADGRRRTFHIRPGTPLGFSYASEIAEQHGISYGQLRTLLRSRGLI